MRLKFYDLDMEEHNSIDIRDVKEIFTYDGKIYIENVDGLMFFTYKITIE